MISTEIPVNSGFAKLRAYRWEQIGTDGTFHTGIKIRSSARIFANGKEDVGIIYADADGFKIMSRPPGVNIVTASACFSDLTQSGDGLITWHLDAISLVELVMHRMVEYDNRINLRIAKEIVNNTICRLISTPHDEEIHTQLLKIYLAATMIANARWCGNPCTLESALQVSTELKDLNNINIISKLLEITTVSLESYTSPVVNTIDHIPCDAYLEPQARQQNRVSS